MSAGNIRTFPDVASLRRCEKENNTRHDGERDGGTGAVSMLPEIVASVLGVLRGEKSGNTLLVIGTGGSGGASSSSFLCPSGTSEPGCWRSCDDTKKKKHARHDGDRDGGTGAVLMLPEMAPSFSGVGRGEKNSSTRSADLPSVSRLVGRVFPHS